MWFFMILCYVFTLVSFCMLILSGLQGYCGFMIFKATHATFAILTIIFYLFTETLIIFYFVGIGVSIKEYVLEKKLPLDYNQRSLKIKRNVYPPILFNILLMMALFISGGAVDTRHLPLWSHGLLFYGSLLHFLKVVLIQHRSFKEATELVLEMAGIKR